MSDNYQSSTAKCFQQPPPFLPEKIRILLRLPVRSLLEYKCICKSWKTLISDPKFAKRQLHILMVMFNCGTLLLDLNPKNPQPLILVINIYTFGGTNSWTTIQNFPSATSFDGKFVSDSGTLNWVIVKSGVSVSSNQGVFLSFDLVNETYKEVLLPEHDRDEIRNARLGVWSDYSSANASDIKIVSWKENNKANIALISLSI
ncbi:uncharacterized protein LOC123886050 [Trifolium pratense]|uniref:uncharacterized protein LOC123886050 n=1 Tax=Trifolium pratense TaxID=57577 RepID=UPI001E697550|nr:uncharacterized protein LOC123886050 [Trifolium pratense]